MMIRSKSIFFLPLLIILSSCASISTNREFYNPILNQLEGGNYNRAANLIEKAVQEDEYSEKDRVLLYLDRGMIYHYQGEYDKSNQEFGKAELAIEELFTKSISKGAASMLLNDNALAYDGEVYEDLYINIFKALNYIHLNDFDAALVEVRRVNVKLRELNLKYKEYIEELNSSEEQQAQVDPRDLDYLNNVFSHYISHILYRAEGDYDNSRISLEKLHEAWDAYSDVYTYEKPSAVTETTSEKNSFLNVIAFAGIAPRKEPVGARITTFDDYVLVSDPTNYYLKPIPFPGIKYGWNFKFEFPELVEEGTEVYAVKVFIDNRYYGQLELLENMANVARKTFETEKSIIYFKTITRAVLKGIGASSLGRTIKKETGSVLGELAAALTNAAFDITEQADLRSWRTMPAYSFVAEYELEPGIYDIEIRFIGENNIVLKRDIYENFEIKNGINLIESYHLR